MKKSVLFSLAFSAVITSLVAQLPERKTYLFDEHLYPRERFADFLTLSANLRFAPSEGKVMGSVTHVFTNLREQMDSLWLDGPGISYFGVVANDDSLSFRVKKEGIWVIFPRTLMPEDEYEFTVYYEAQPKKGMYFIGWKDPNNLMPKQIWTQGQGIDNRYWLPCFDDQAEKVITQMTLSFEEGYEVISNGSLKKKKSREGITTWEYEMEHPHSPYLVMIAIGKYDYVERKSTSGVPLTLYFYPEHRDRVEITYRNSTDMVDFMENYTGIEYPWENYKQVPVADYLYGAMENTTATIFGDFFMVDKKAANDREYLDVNAHELAHQWFGDYVTARSGAHHWLHESFATFFQMRYTREVKGEDYYRWWMRENAQAAFSASEENLMGIGHHGAGSARHYLKGGYVLDMMTYVMGEEHFKRGLHHYLQEHPYGLVETNDLLFAFHDATGHDLYWFFDQWVRKGGEPEYDVAFQEIETEAGRIGEFEVAQVHKTNELLDFFKMPFVFEVHYRDRTKDSIRITIEKPFEKVQLPLAEKEVAFVLFDPNSRVLKKVTFKKPTEMLVQQLLHAPHMIDRYDAAVALREVPMEEKAFAYVQAVQNETFQAVKAEIASQLVPMMKEEHYELIKALLEDKEPKVIKAVLQNTPFIPNELLDQYESLLAYDSYEVIEMALEVLYLRSKGDIRNYLAQTKDIEGIKANNVRIKWLEIAYASTGELEYALQLVEYTSNSYDFLTRKKAAKTLQDLNFLNEQAAYNLMDATLNPNRRLRGPCTKVIRHFYAQIPYKPVIQKAYFGHDWTAEEKERLNKVIR